jgi:hypothetical protein
MVTIQVAIHEGDFSKGDGDDMKQVSLGFLGIGN